MSSDFDQSSKKIQRKLLEKRLRTESILQELIETSVDLKPLVASEILQLLKSEELLVSSFTTETHNDSFGTKKRIRISLVKPDFVLMDSSEEEEDTSLSGES